MKKNSIFAANLKEVKRRLQLLKFAFDSGRNFERTKVQMMFAFQKRIQNCLKIVLEKLRGLQNHNLFVNCCCNEVEASSRSSFGGRMRLASCESK